MIDDFDELASAYLDGQATPDEVARVEADPELRARVDALRAVAGQLAGDLPGPPPDTRARHLAAALAAFDVATSASPDDPVVTAPATTAPAGGSGDGSGGPGSEAGPGLVEVGGARIIDLSDRRHGGGIDAPPPVRTSPQRTATTAAPAGTVAERRRRRAGGPPSWLGAAAATVLVVGGVGLFAANRGPSGESETAFVSQDTAESDAETSLTGDEATEMLAQEMAPAVGGANEDDAEGSRELADEEAAATTTAAESEPGSLPGDQDRLSFPAVPTEAELVAARAGLPLRVSAVSVCGGLVAPPEGGELAGYLPVDVDGVDGEALVFALAGGGESIVLVTIDCQPF